MRGPVDDRRLDRPARRAGDEREDFDARRGGAADQGVGPVPVEAAVGVGLHGAPFDRDADAVDAAQLQPLELFGVRRRLRGDAPEVARHRAGARREPPQRDDRAAIAAAHARARPWRPLPVCDTGLAGLRRERGAGAVPLAPLANHDHGDRDRGEHGDRDQDRHQRRGAAVVGGSRASAWSAGRRAAPLPSPAGWCPCLVYPDPCRRPLPVSPRRRPSDSDGAASVFRYEPSLEPVFDGRFGAAVLRRLGRLRDFFVLRTAQPSA